MGDAPLPPAMAIADSPGLDFLNSVANPGSGVIDWLANGAGLLDWMTQLSVTSPRHLEQLESVALPGELDAVAAQARSLREWFRGFVAERAGSPLGADALTVMAPLNAILARDCAHQVVCADGGVLTMAWHHRVERAEDLMLPIARMVAETVVHADFAQVKHCEGAGCTLWFEDHTRGHRRRWCSMAMCGNRAKQAHHRARQREDMA